MPPALALARALTAGVEGGRECFGLRLPFGPFLARPGDRRPILLTVGELNSGRSTSFALDLEAFEFGLSHN